VVGGILSVSTPLTLSTFGALLDDGTGQDHTCGVIQDVLSRLRSVLSLPDPEMEHLQPIRIIHPSFVDFLGSYEEWSGVFYINPPNHHADLVHGCVKLVMEHGNNNSGEAGVISYAMANLSHHFHHALNGPCNPGVLNHLREALENLRDLLLQLHNTSGKWHFDPDQSQKFWQDLMYQLQVSSVYIRGIIII
jgi:hypothetical protein